LPFLALDPIGGTIGGESVMIPDVKSAIFLAPVQKRRFKPTGVKSQSTTNSKHILISSLLEWRRC